MSETDEAERGDRRMADRMIFFSDAIFSIALTLLVLELRPWTALSGDEAALWSGAGKAIPQFIAFLISFALAAMWWLVHLNATRRLKAFDWPTTLCNLFFLFWITLLPFAAAYFGANYWSAAALAIYWIINAGASFGMLLLWLVMTRAKGRLVGGVRGLERWGASMFTLGSGVACVAGAWFAFTGQVWLSRFAWLSMTPFFVAAIIMLSAAKPRAPA